MQNEQTIVESVHALSVDELQKELLNAPLAILHLAIKVGEERGVPPSAEVSAACRAAMPELLAHDSETLLDTVTQCLLTRDVEGALQWLLDIGFMEAYLPELAATVDLAQEGGRRHKDVWEHTTLVVKQAVKRPLIRWAALLHDIGKVPTRTFTTKGVHFHGHAEVGARMFDKVAKRIPFPRTLRKQIRFLIKHHLRAAQYGQEWSDSAVRRFDREMGEQLGDLLDLSRADITSKRPGRRKSLVTQIARLHDRIEALRAEDALIPPLHKGIGNAIMAEFDLPPSRHIGDLKRALLDAIERGDLDGRQPDEVYLSWLASSGLIER